MAEEQAQKERREKPEQAVAIAPEPRLTSRLIDTIPDGQMRRQLTF